MIGTLILDAQLVQQKNSPAVTKRNGPFPKDFTVFEIIATGVERVNTSPVPDHTHSVLHFVIRQLSMRRLTPPTSDARRFAVPIDSFLWMDFYSISVVGLKAACLHYLQTLNNSVDPMTETLSGILMQ